MQPVLKQRKHCITSFTEDGKIKAFEFQINSNSQSEKKKKQLSLPKDVLRDLILYIYPLCVKTSGFFRLPTKHNHSNRLQWCPQQSNVSNSYLLKLNIVMVSKNE